MSVTARLYIGLMLTLGAAALGQALWLWNPQDLLRFFCYLTLAIPASCLKVRLPGVTGTMSVLFLFLLPGIAELGWPETLVIGSICVLIQSFWRARVRPRVIQVLFSIANISLAISLAGLVYHSPLPFISHIQTPFRLTLAASILFFANTFPIAAVIALTERKSLRDVWSHCYSWSFPYYMIGAAIVGVFSFANRLLDWQVWLLILPTVYVIYRSYHLYFDKLENERSQGEKQRQHAEEVATLLASAVTANAKLDAVIQASPLAILALDQDGRVTSWNHMAECIFGWKSEEVLGVRLPFASEEAKDSIEALVERTARGESLSGIEVTQRRRDGSAFEAAFWSAQLRQPFGNVCGILLTVADVSDRRRLEEQLRLSQKMEAVGRLAGGVAHDFNNLLTVINGYSSMLVDSLRADAYTCSLAEEILGAGNRAASLVSQLLTFSRRQVIKPEPLEINQFVIDIERMLGRLIGEHIEVRTVLEKQGGYILADHSQMASVLMNLATNARDAMPNGGTLTIETRRVQVDAAADAVQPDLSPGCYWCLVVRDTGKGMDAATQQHMFEPFFTTKERGKGTGLGLSSVYGGVEQNRGHIFVSSGVGKGTTFSIYLPCFEALQAPESSPARSRTWRRGSETILLVEDEAALRRMLRQVLSKAGHRVWEAGDGIEGLEQWEKAANEIDLVVTDIVMPVMNGLTMAEELKNRDPNLKVIFMSGHADELISSQGALGPGINLLQKPFAPEELVGRIREALDQPQDPKRTLATG